MTHWEKMTLLHSLNRAVDLYKQTERAARESEQPDDIDEWVVFYEAYCKIERARKSAHWSACAIATSMGTTRNGFGGRLQ